MDPSSIGSPALWAGFLLFVIGMLALDLGVFHRKAHVVSMKEAAIWSSVWIGLALLFGMGVWWRAGADPAMGFFTGYLIEKTLSVDNIFVFVLIFSSLAIPAIHQHRVLFWGILTALVLRAGMIFAGGAVLARFHWLIYVFGGFLILTGLKLFWTWLKGDKDEGEPSALRFARRFIPATDKLDGARFLTKVDKRWLATPLLMALMLVELTDVVFALDSIPAIFAITQDPFIVFTSNIFAILGLRSLFFLLGDMLEKFHYLKASLAAVLVFVGSKMALVSVLPIGPLVSLIAIASMIAIGVVASLLRARALSAGLPSRPQEIEQAHAQRDRAEAQHRKNQQLAQADGHHFPARIK